MTGIQMAVAIVLIVISLTTIVLVMVQKNRDANLSGAITGGDSAASDSFFDKTKNKRKSSGLENATRVMIWVLLIASVAGVCILLFV